ncbi:hypothetical protein [Luteimonas sp. TWI662]|uniref:hypothetical protein n=1 Tax=unclassified Luteimonas TaxID=2629088 RepID=UPI0032099AFF
MRHRLAAGLLAALTLGVPMSHAFAQSTVAPQHPGAPGYDVLLDAATAPLRSALGDRVVVEVERLDRLGDWAFLQGTLRAPGGGRPDYAGTPYAERAAAGGMSDVYVALLRAQPAQSSADEDAREPPTDDGASTELDPPTPRWTVLDHAIGPSDVAWLTWPETHAAPRQLFGF